MTWQLKLQVIKDSKLHTNARLANSDKLHRITDEGSVPEMRIWSILLIKSDSKWCLHLSRSNRRIDSRPLETKITLVDLLYSLLHFRFSICNNETRDSQGVRTIISYTYLFLYVKAKTEKIEQNCFHQLRTGSNQYGRLYGSQV